MKIKQLLFFFFGLLFTWTPIIFCFTAVDATGLSRWITVTVMIFSLIVITAFLNGVYEHIYPSPKMMTTGDVKSFFQSKIFWLAFVNFLMLVFSGLFGVEFEQGFAEAITGVDYTKGLQAIITMLIIALRKSDILKKLSA